MYLLLIIQLILQLTNNIVYSLSTNFMSYSSIQSSININKQYSTSNYVSYSYQKQRSYININSVSYYSQKKNSIGYSYNSQSYKSYSYVFSVKMYPTTMNPTSSNAEIPQLNFETDLRMDGVKTDKFDELEKNAIIKTTARTLNVSEENLYWKNAYFENLESQNNLRLQSNVKLRIIIQVNITLTGIYSPYIKNPTMLFTLLSTNLDLGVSSNTFNTYLQTITMILNLLKFANANLITATNNNMQILGVDLTFNASTNVSTFMPTLSSQFPTLYPTTLLPSMQSNISINMSTFTPSLSSYIPTLTPTTLRPSMQPNISTELPTFTPSLSSQIPTLSPTTLRPSMQPIISTLVPIFVTSHGPTYMTSIIPTNYPTNLSNCPSSIMSHIPSKYNATSEQLKNNKEESDKIFIYAIYIPIALLVSIYLICILSKKVKNKFNKLELEPIIPKQELKTTYIKNNKVADETNV